MQESGSQPARRPFQLPPIGSSILVSAMLAGAVLVFEKWSGEAIVKPTGLTWAVMFLGVFAIVTILYNSRRRRGR